mmetsp:Transcript_9880/g.20767  ORF Transcript_9880/g.20767 Transcript_9880/m.20767 type:complete len:96 (-) Transcript_9880:233-520(-)
MGLVAFDPKERLSRDTCVLRRRLVAIPPTVRAHRGEQKRPLAYDPSCGPPHCSHDFICDNDAPVVAPARGACVRGLLPTVGAASCGSNMDCRRSS